MDRGVVRIQGGRGRNSEIKTDKTQVRVDKKVEEWSKQYLLHHHGIRTLAARPAHEPADAAWPTPALFSLFAEAGLTLEEVRALMLMTHCRNFAHHA